MPKRNRRRAAFVWDRVALTGFAPVRAPTPPDVRFSASGGWRRHGVLARKVGWRDEPISLQDAVAEGFLQHGVPPHVPGAATAMGKVSPRRWDSQAREGGAASAGVVPALPKAFPDMAADPAAQSQDAAPFLGPAIVGPESRVDSCSRRRAVARCSRVVARPICFSLGL